MDPLVHIVQDLSKVRTLPEIINIVRTAARKATGADGATFVLRDNGYCFYVDEDAIGPLWKGKRFILSSCISGWAMLNKQPVAIQDIFQDSRIPIEAYKPTFVKSLAMVPIRQSEPIGAIGIYWAKPHLATDSELAVLQPIADTTSVAIENVGLLNSLEERVAELENANHLKDEFLMLISHELRTPLNSILGWSEMLVDEDDGVDPQLRTGLQAIYRNSKIQSQVIDNLLDASTIVLGKFSIESKKINFVDLFDETLKDLAESANIKAITLNVNKLITSAFISGEATRLKQVVEILVSNAIKFSSQNSIVNIELVNEGPSLCLKVRDFGIGIEGHALPHLFNRFSQTEKYIRRSYGGLGLGLTIAKSIVDAHRGRISVLSEGLGKGAEFIVSFPLIDQTEQNLQFQTVTNS